MEIVRFLKEEPFKVFNMNLKDCKSFKPDVCAYFRRYFNRDYNLAGNHLCSYALKHQIVAWLDPKPMPYRDTAQKISNYKG